jgi:hypothetical protein
MEYSDALWVLRVASARLTGCKREACLFPRCLYALLPLCLSLPLCLVVCLLK